MSWFLYVLECADGSLYTGITNDVPARYAAHAAGKGARYTKGRPPRRLLAVLDCADRASASRAEYEVKQLSLPRKREFCRLHTPAPALTHACQGQVAAGEVAETNGVVTAVRSSKGRAGSRGAEEGGGQRDKGCAGRG